MKQRTVQLPRQSPMKTGQIALRLDADLHRRFQAVVEASRRSKTSIVEQCLEEVLPRLEKQFAKAA